ncbi:MAG: hypothetical protein NW202_13050 [Nitrospira sp.]|nr:hypothetical protein [Nitrospira sp.]
MEFTHPIQQHAANFPGNWDMAKRQADEWDAVDAAMTALQPGDPNAEAVLRGGLSLLQSIVINYGPHEWCTQQGHMIFQHAERVFGAGQSKFNRPIVIHGNGPAAPRFHGMRFKYRHSGGL